MVLPDREEIQIIGLFNKILLSNIIQLSIDL